MTATQTVRDELIVAFCSLKLSPLIVKCVVTMFLVSLSSTRWIGRFFHAITLSESSKLISFNPYSAGANPERVLQQLRTKLRMNAAMVQLPMGAEADFDG
jgi:hypothetical protein